MGRIQADTFQQGLRGAIPVFPGHKGAAFGVIGRRIGDLGLRGCAVKEKQNPQGTAENPEKETGPPAKPPRNPRRFRRGPLYHEAGFVFDLFGKIPVKYEKAVYGGYDFNIQDMEGHKINSVKIVVKQEPAS